jgi:tRNA 2-selenouridine synthase
MPTSLQSIFIVISGKTGSGKSAILKCLSSQQCPVIDLEKIAMHRGSAFGAAGNEQAQPSQEFFEKNLQQICEVYKSAAFIFIEQKPSSIGKRKIPDWFYKKMMGGLIVQLNVSKNLRVENILKEYFNTERKQQNILAALDKLSERFSKEKILFLGELILKKNYTAFINEMLDYYDQSSKYKINKKPFIEIFVEDEYNAQNISHEIIQSLNSKGIMLS